MPKKSKNTKTGKPAPDEPEAPEGQPEPVPQHLHDETRRPLKAPPGGVPPNLPRQFPGKAGHFSQIKGGNRNFRHQGR
jgi:hypothetical protein